MKKVQLYALTTKGKVKTWMVSTKGDTILTEWGLLGGKIQSSTKVCKGLNEGKANATTPAQQAEVEALAMIVQQQKDGYTEEIPDEGGSVLNVDLDLDQLPVGFVLSKPISDCPDKVKDGENTYAQRKFNGNCIVLKKTATQQKVYSRTMEDITEYILPIPEVTNLMNSINAGDMVNTEVHFIRHDTGKESTAYAGSLLRTQNAAEVMEKYNEYKKLGFFEIIVFDKIFHRSAFIGNFDYLERYEELKKMLPNGVRIPDIIWNWKSLIDYDEKGRMIPAGKAADEGWEGFVLRVKGQSLVTYTTNGKADRAGAYKLKFTKEGDFVVSEIEYGKSGKAQDVYARFKIGQYDKKTGELLDCGWAGPGKLTYDELAQYTKEIKSGKLKLPFVVEIEFREWQEDSLKLEHPVIQRLRFDKKPKECEYEG